MTESLPVFVSLLTPPGRGALATIGVRGPRAWQITQACLDSSHAAAGDGQRLRPRLRRLASGGGVAEEIVVVFPSERETRLHCHGGVAACEAVLRSLTEQGAVRVDWRHWSAAEPAGNTIRAARVALADALTERAALILLDQLHGALDREMVAIAELMLGRETASIVQQRIDQLLTRAPLGLHLTQPWRVVIAGRPNAGKSSLLNALLGFQRAITSEQPGTTRDVVTARTAFDGWPVELADTAGLRASNDPLEAAGIELAEREVRQADLVLYVIPADNRGEEVDRELATLMFLPEQIPLLLVRSKADLNRAAESKGLYVSALRGDGLASLIEAVAQRLIGTPPDAGEPVPFTLQQVDMLQQARGALIAGDFACAHRLLTQFVSAELKIQP